VRSGAAGATESGPGDRPGLRLICATTVPFAENGDLDADGLAALFGSLRATGFRYVFAAGTTGEFIALSDDERMKVIAAALEVFGPAGVYAHVGAATARGAVRLTRRAAEAGVQRFAAITPYFLEAGPQAVRHYYEAIAERLAGGELYAYIFPARATTSVSPEALAELALLDGMRGAKLSGLPVSSVAQYVAAAPPGFSIFSGNDRDVPELASIGAAGLVSGVSAVFPSLFLDAISAINRGDDIGRYRQEIDRAVDAVAGGDIGLLKAGVSSRGLPAGPLRVSIDPPEAAALRKLQHRLGEAGSSRAMEA
jgi:4-hydroxy-tetrahydrodipicolinate synthase